MDPSLLPSLAWFAQVAHHRSFTKAALALGVSRAALSQSLKTLEQRLNTRLLHRTTRHMSLTEAGQRLLDTLHPSLSQIDQALRDLDQAGGQASGLLRVNTSRIAARTLIEPHLPELLTRHPALHIELVMDDGLSNIVADGCDVGIRLGEALAPNMVAVPVTTPLRMAVVASPAYLAQHGRPATPADLAQHQCVGYRYQSGALHQWEFTIPGPRGHAFTVAPQGRCTTSDDESLLRLAVQGAGLVQHLDIAVQTHLRAGTLVSVLQRWCAPFAGFYLYAPSRRHMPAKVRALMDWLIERREAGGAVLG